MADRNVRPPFPTLCLCAFVPLFLCSFLSPNSSFLIGANGASREGVMGNHSGIRASMVLLTVGVIRP